VATAPVLVVHGGAGAWQPELLGAAANGIHAALTAGWERLRDGTAVDAVEAAVAALEDDETFNAGRGSCLTSDGRVQMDALIMDGGTLAAGAVACVERLRNPVRAARQILEHSPHVLFAGADAERLAEQLGLTLCDNEALITDRQRRRLSDSQDTVGAVALDAAGGLAAATSTGGMAGKAPGRLGDSPLIGCGGYADNEAGAASTTGWGEAIMKLLLAKWAADRLRVGIAPDRAATLAIDYLQRRLNGSGGIILLDRDGGYAAASNAPAMPWGVKTARQELVQELQGELA
jgi:L-asparaginase / beta-aspartyl-peptidase